MPVSELMENMEGAAEALNAALEARDLPTHNHSNRVTTLAGRLGDACGLAPDELDLLEHCARLHDLGKIGIPDAVLRKPGPLTREEYTIIQQHSTIGATLIRRINSPGIEAVADIVEHHHERFDGKGYPAGLGGEAIPLLSRIITLADCYDAMTSPRHYHGAHSHEAALAVIREERGTHFDPELSDIFTGLLDLTAAD